MQYSNEGNLDETRLCCRVLCILVIVLVYTDYNINDIISTVMHNRLKQVDLHVTCRCMGISMGYEWHLVSYVFFLNGCQFGRGFPGLPEGRV